MNIRNFYLYFELHFSKTNGVDLRKVKHKKRFLLLVYLDDVSNMFVQHIAPVFFFFIPFLSILIIFYFIYFFLSAKITET